MTHPPLDAGFTYPEVGATRHGPLPAGYRHLRHHTPLAPTTYEDAGEAVLTWRMHRGVGVRVVASADRAAPGVQMTSLLGVGPLRLAAPCQVVWTLAERDRVGFAYGTLPGHPELGEESFVVSRDDTGAAWLTVTSFSRPARWFTRLAGPVVPLLQREFARRCGRALRRLPQRP